MKKAMITCIMCALLSSMILIGCSSSPSLPDDSSISLAEAVPTTIPNIDGYEFAVHEKFNSAAKDNGLANTKIYTEGTIIQINTKEEQVYGRLNADDGNWTVIFGTEEIVDVEELRNLYLTKNVKVFGTYLGLSSVTTYPVIFLEKVQHGSETLMYNQLTDYAQISQKDSTLAKETIEKPTEKETEPPTEAISREFKNALDKAKSYLNHSAFSKDGLFGQLLYEKFSEDAAQYAVDHVNTDWNENALKKAKSYMNYSAFSKEGLFNQLIYEKYTDEEARYAVDNINADWNEAAVKKAESYLSHSSFSKDRLYEQLIYEKFTEEEAQYAVDQVY